MTIDRTDYIELITNIECYDDFTTNKKCPICGSTISVHQEDGGIYCENGCVDFHVRGI